MEYISRSVCVIACVLSFCLKSVASEIHDAVSAGDAVKVAGALEKSAESVNLADENGKVPLHIAIEKNNEKIVRLLLSKGANPETRDRSGRTPFRIALDSDATGCANVIVATTTIGYTEPLLDIRQKEGIEAQKDGTLAKANEMLGRLVRLDPASENINFAYGLSWLSLGDPSPAGAAFERVLSINPRNSRARAEMARARIAAGRYREAQKELEKILASELTMPARRTVETCLKELKGRLTRWYYSANIEAGCLYDSNVNIGPDSTIIRISPISIFGTTITELQLSEKSKPADTTGFSVSASGRSFYDLGEPNGWLLTSEGAYYHNWLEESDYETTSAQAGIGLKKMTDRGFFHAPFRARYIEYSGDPLVWLYGLYPSFGYAPANMNGVSFITTVSAEWRDFDALTGRDGYYVSLDEIIRKPLARGKYNIYCGAEIEHDHADSPVYQYTGAGVLLGADARLPWKINAVLEGRYFYRDYKEKFALALNDRKDDQYQLSAGISKDISARFVISLTYSMINNQSTFDLYEYKRNITMLSTSLKF